MPHSKDPDFFSTQVTDARRFYMDLHPRPCPRITVVSGGCEHCLPGYRIHRSTFPYLSIEFVAGGRGQVTLGGRTFALAAGTLFSYGPRIAQNITTDPRETLVKYFVDFVGDEARRMLRDGNFAPGALAQTSAPSEIAAIFEDLLRNGLRNTPYTPRICAALVEQLILKIAETLIPPGSAESHAFATYRRCRRHIGEHGLKLRTLGEIAQGCHVNPAYLCRLFQRFDHQSPYQYLLRLKMNDAAERLQQPGALVKQVADSLGFADPYHFSRVFKKIFGIAPVQFVKLRRER